MVFFTDPPSNPFKLRPWLIQFKNGVLTGNFSFGSAVAANTVYAGPTSGGDANPTFRALVDADIPGLDASKIDAGIFDTARIPNLDASKITSGTINDARIDWASPPSIGFGTQSPGRFSNLTSESLAGDTYLTVDGNAFDNKYLRFSSDSDFINPSRQFDARWTLSVEDDDLGSNQGSNLYLKSWNDTGTSYTVMSLDRAPGGSGEIEFFNIVRFNQDVEFNDFVTFQGGSDPIFVGTATFQDATTFEGDLDLAAGININFGTGGGISGLTSLTLEELSITGGLANAEITNGALNMTSSSINFTGTTSISGLTDLEVTGNITNGVGSVTVDDAFVVTGTTDLRGNVSNSTGSLTLADNVIITGNLDIQGTISDSTGNITISDSVDMTGTFALTGAATVSSTLTVTGSTICNNGARMGGDPGTGVASTVIFTNNVAGTPSNNTTPSAWLKVYNGTGVRYMPIYT